MKVFRGDISNKRSYAFGFRCENSLLKYKDIHITDKFFNLFSGKTHRAEVNKDVYSLMEFIYWNTEYTVMLVIDERNYTEEAKNFLSNFPFNQVVNVLKSPSEITMKLNTGEMSYYIDDCESSRYKVQSKYAITSKDLNTILKRKYGRLT